MTDEGYFQVVAHALAYANGRIVHNVKQPVCWACDNKRGFWSYTDGYREWTWCYFCRPLI
jgi:hypothetical protein